MPDKILVTNRKARRDYLILDTLEAGIVLMGPEVKSLRQGQGNLSDSYAALNEGEVWLHNAHISPYGHGGVFNPPPKRRRKLLLHQREIKRLIGQTAVRGHTLIPLKLYLKNGRVKVELAVARGKKLYDRREDVRKRESEREISRSLRRKTGS